MVYSRGGGTLRHPVIKDSIAEPQSTGVTTGVGDNMEVIVCEQISVLTRFPGGGGTNFLLALIF